MLAWTNQLNKGQFLDRNPIETSWVDLLRKGKEGEYVPFRCIRSRAKSCGTVLEQQKINHNLYNMMNTYFTQDSTQDKTD